MLTRVFTVVYLHRVHRWAELLLPTQVRFKSERKLAESSRLSWEGEEQGVLLQNQKGSTHKPSSWPLTRQFHPANILTLILPLGEWAFSSQLRYEGAVLCQWSVSFWAFPCRGSSELATPLLATVRGPPPLVWEENEEPWGTTTAYPKVRPNSVFLVPLWSPLFLSWASGPVLPWYRLTALYVKFFHLSLLCKAEVHRRAAFRLQSQLTILIYTSVILVGLA